MARPKKVKEVKVAESGYKLTLICLREKATSEGATIEEALDNLNARNFKGKGIMQVTHNGVTREKILMPSTILRFSNSMGLSRQIIIKNLSILLK